MENTFASIWASLLFSFAPLIHLLCVTLRPFGEATGGTEDLGW